MEKTLYAHELIHIQLWMIDILDGGWITHTKKEKIDCHSQVEQRQ